MKLFLSRIHFPITSLGPGNRIGIWFQGCSIHCPGCISEDTWNANTGDTTVQDVVEAIRPWISQADGVTISGGEPFDQSEALHALLDQIRSLIKGDILVFSGYPYSAIHSRISEMKGLIDALISEPFLTNTSQTKPLRGSDNQVVHKLTPLGQKVYQDVDNPNIWQTKALDIMFDGDETFWIAGIPQRGDLQRIRSLIQLEGFESRSSENGEPLNV